jgi:mRNA degradation ribonuclease J1/J2
LAKSVGLPSTLVLENGDIAELSGVSLTKTNRKAPQRVHRFMARPIAPTVLKERLALGPQGVVVVSLVLDASGKLITKPQVRCRGVLDPAAFAAFSADASRSAARALEDLSVDDRQDDATVEETARLAVRRVVAQAVGYKPVTLAVVHRVA